MQIKKIIAVISLVLLSTPVLAEIKECTNLDKAHWLKQEEIQKILSERGYKIINFELSGSCYKIHMETKEGKQIEGIYNPVEGHPMQRKIK
jgi:hypothetical protein